MLGMAWGDDMGHLKKKRLFVLERVIIINILCSIIFFIKFFCVSCTDFGEPVVPDVNRIRHKSSLL